VKPSTPKQPDRARSATWVVPPDLGRGLLDSVNIIAKHLRRKLSGQPQEAEMVALLAEIARRGITRGGCK
jgi:hypothetical protein